jgi:hypothetical protein
LSSNSKYQFHHEVLSLATPNWTKVFKDNYRKYSVPTGAGADDTTTMKVPVFERGSLGAALYWCKQFQDLIELKGLDATAKFTNANILTSDAGRTKWQEAQAEVLGNRPSRSPRQSSS